MFVTMCTFGRRPYFTSSEGVALVRTLLLRTTPWAQVEVTAYCFMPDHLQALIAGTVDGADTKSFVDAFRRMSGYHYRRAFGGRLWQAGYFERMLRDEEATLAVVAYIIANPVRKGLCSQPDDYPYTGSSRFAAADLAAAVH